MSDIDDFRKWARRMSAMAKFNEKKEEPPEGVHWKTGTFSNTVEDLWTDPRDDDKKLN